MNTKLKSMFALGQQGSNVKADANYNIHSSTTTTKVGPETLR